MFITVKQAFTKTGLGERQVKVTIIIGKIKL